MQQPLEPQTSRAGSAVLDRAPRRVLFVCTGNTCRSPMAAALLNDLARGGADRPDVPALRAASAGLFADVGAPIHPEAVAALREAGVAARPDNDYPAHRARAVSEELMAQADEVLAMTGAHAMELLLRYPACASKIDTLPMEITDPFGKSIEAYRECLFQLRTCLALRYGFSEGKDK